MSEQASHHEYSFAKQRAIVDRATGRVVDTGRGECPCGWSTTGREDDCMRQYAEHVRAASSDADQAH